MTSPPPASNLSGRKSALHLLSRLAYEFWAIFQKTLPASSRRWSLLCHQGAPAVSRGHPPLLQTTRIVYSFFFFFAIASQRLLVMAKTKAVKSRDEH